MKSIRKPPTRIDMPGFASGCRLDQNRGLSLIRKSKRVFSSSAALSVVAIVLVGCAPLPGSSVTNAATIVYTAGASQYTAAVELPVQPPIVFEAMIRLVNERPNVEVVDRNDKAFLIKVAEGPERHLTGQVTKLGSGNSLLYIWADAGGSGQTGQELAISTVELICDELGVDYELVNY
jgi:hypothetical protein